MPQKKLFQRIGDVFRPSEQKDDPAYQMYAQFISPGQPIYTPRDFKNLATFGYEKNITTFKAISLIAQSCAGIPWKLTKKTDKKRVLESHPLLDLFAQPNPRHGTGTFLEEIVSYWILAGNAYMYAVCPSPRAAPTELWTMRPDRMRVIPGIGTIAGYEYTLDGHRQYYEAPNIMHLKMFSATNDWYGLSPVAVASALIDQQNEGFDWNTAILQNAGRPSGALVASGTLGNDQFERLRRVIREKYTGKKNAGVPLLLEGGLDWKQFSMSPMELDWQESRKQNMRDISIALGVPSELLGDNANKTYCLPYDTRIETVHGSLPIGMLTPGVEVYSYDQTFNTVVKRRITRQWKTGTKKVYRLCAGDRAIRATDNHPFLIARHNKNKNCYDGLYFVRVDDLQVGDLLVRSLGNLKETYRHQCVYSDDVPSLPVGCAYIQLETIEEQVEIDVYDIEVEGTHTFFAEGFCVHNSNYGEARKSFYQETILPLMDKLRDRLNVWLVPMFDGDLELHYDKDQVEALQEDRDSLNTRVMAQWNAGVTTLNEVRNLLGLTEVDGGDFFNMTTLNKAFVPEEMLQKFVAHEIEQAMAPPPAAPGAPGVPGAPPPPAVGAPPTQPQLPPAKPTPPQSPPDPASSPVTKPGQGPKTQDAETMGRTIVTEVKSQKNVAPDHGIEPVRNALTITAQQVINRARKAALPGEINSSIQSVWDASKKGIKNGLSLCSERAGRAGIAHTQKNLMSVAHKKKDATSDFWKKIVEDYEKKHGGQSVEHIIATMRDQVSRQIDAGISEGESVDQIVDRLSEYLTAPFLENKAKTIAQTEWTVAYNFGSEATAGDYGVPLTKIWVAMNDGHDRPSHAEAHGQDRAFEELFDVDEEQMLYPGDLSSGASIENVVGCRCSMIFIPADDPDQEGVVRHITSILDRTEKHLFAFPARHPKQSVSERYKQFQEVVRK